MPQLVVQTQVLDTAWVPVVGKVQARSVGLHQSMDNHKHLHQLLLEFHCKRPPDMAHRYKRVVTHYIIQAICSGVDHYYQIFRIF